MEWISVKDKLPEYNQEVLFTYGKTYLRGRYVSGGDFIEYDFYGTLWNIEDDIITHWIPLPELPNN